MSILVSSSTLSHVILANGSQTLVKGVGKVLLLLFLSLTTVLFTPKCPNILISINKLTKNLHCSVTFYAGSVIVQDLITRKTIGAGYELQILYHLFASPVALISTTIELIHNPSVVKLQKLVPSLSAISYLFSYSLGLLVQQNWC